MIKKLVLVLTLGLFSQFAMADAASAIKEVADIVASINHFPSEEDKAKLATISADETLPPGLRAMAKAVANISHAATAEDKAAMAAIQENDAAPDMAKALAGIIAGINHVPSAEAKATLANLFP